jgi:nucleoside-diphosphate-sugar epimerase
MARYLVTGGAGFIGSHLVNALIRQGELVRVLDNFLTGKRANLAEVEGHYELLEVDIRAHTAVQSAMRGVDFVLHQAALPSVPRSVRDPLASHEINITGTLNVLQAAREAGVKRVVLASSSSVYGANAELPKRESMCPQPLSPYAITKLAGEQYALAYTRLYGLETVSLRYFNVFGPRQDPQSEYAAVIPRFIRALIADQLLVVHGDGRQSRDFTYVDNVVHANLLACSAAGAAGVVCNVACGEKTTLLDLIDRLAVITGKTPHVEFSESRPADVPHSLADTGVAQRLLGYVPVVDFATGLERTVASLRATLLA